MPSTKQSIIISASIDNVWERFASFHEMPWAANILSDIEIVGDKNGDEVGAKRVLNGAFHETLTMIDSENYHLEYSIDDGPSPVSKEEVSNYTGVIQLSPAKDAEGTLVVWNSSWQSNSEDAVEFCHGIYIALLGELKSSFQ